MLAVRVLAYLGRVMPTTGHAYFSQARKTGSVSALGWTMLFTWENDGLP